MILHGIEITHTGGFRQPIRVGPFARSLNVLAAANESGKSTLIRAAVRALFDKHTSKDSDIKSLRPVGSELAPKVAVDFETSSGRYRIEKTFLTAPRSTLQQMRDGAWQLIAEADAADQRVQKILNATLPSRGASKPEHWGLLGFLWARQGERAEWPDLATDEPSQRIRNHLVRVEIDPVIERIRAALTNEADAILTDTGKPKAKGSLETAETELARIDGEIVSVSQLRAQLEDQHGRFDQLNAEVAALESEHTESERRSQELLEQAKKASHLQIELEKLTADHQQASERLQTITRDAGSLLKWKRELDEAAETIEQIAKTTQDAEATILQTRAALGQKEKQLGEIEERLVALRQSHARAGSLLKMRQAATETARLQKQSERAGKAAAELAGLEQKRAQLPNVSAAALRKLEEIDSRIRDLRAQARVSGLSIALTPDKDAEIAWKQSGAEKTEKLKAREEHALQADQQMDLHLAGWGKIMVRSGAKELRELSKELEQCQGSLDQALLAAQSPSIEAARESLAARQDLDTRIKAGQSALRDLLGEQTSAADLAKLAAESQKQTEALSAQLQPNSDEQKLASVEIEASQVKFAASIATAEKEAKAVSAAIDSARRDERAALDAAQSARQKHTALQIQHKTLETKLDEMLTRYTGQLDEGLAAAQRDFVQTEARLKVAQSQMPPDFAQLPDRSKRAARALQEVADQLQNKRTERDAIRGALTTLGGQGLYSRETDLIERREDVLRRRDSAKARGWAARIARDLIEFRKQAATRAVLTPLEDRLSGVFARMTADTTRRVFLDENLQITGVGRTREECHAFDLLSQGAKEQLLLCLRLAAAQELATAEPQVLILDDVLVNTDTIRQQRILDVLTEAAHQLQIIILTCHADRYRGIGETMKIEAVA